MYIACSFIIHFIYSNSIPECIRQPIRSTLFTLKKTTMPKVYFDLMPQRDQRSFAKILKTILELERTISWNTEQMCTDSLESSFIVCGRICMNLICSQFTVNSDPVWKIYLKIRTHTFSIGKEFILRRYIRKWITTNT